MQMQNPSTDLKLLIEGGYLSESALSTVTGVQPDALSNFLREDSSGMGYIAPSTSSTSSDEDARLSILAAQLVDASAVDDDDRLKGILESLTIACGLSIRNVALLTRVDDDLLTTALRDPGLLSFESKYALAIRASYLINAFGRSQPR